MAKKEQSGNSVGASADFARAVMEQAAPIVRFERTAERCEESGVFLTGLRIRLPEVYGGDMLLVVSAHIEGRGVVGFYAGGSLLDVLSGGLRRVENGDLRWKDDKYKGQ